MTFLWLFCVLKKYFTKFSTFANQENIYYLLAEKLKTEKTRTDEFIIFEKNDSTSFVSASCLLANTACHVMVEGEGESVLVTRNNIDSCIEIKDTEKIRI